MASNPTPSRGPDVIVGVLGQEGHGKSTLTLTLGEQFGEVLQSADDPPRIALARSGTPLTLASCHSSTRSYRLHDHHTHRDWMIELLAGQLSLDIALLVVAADEGPMDEMRKQVQFLRLLEIEPIVVFLSKEDLMQEEPALMDLAEWEVRTLLSEYHYRGDDIPIIRGDARSPGQGLGPLLHALDACPVDSVRPIDQPFLMGIEDVFFIKARGTVVTGRIERGRVRPGDEVELVGLSQSSRVLRVTGVESFGRITEEGRAGENVGLLLRQLPANEVERGQVLAQPGSTSAHTRFEANVYLMTREESGLEANLCSGSQLPFYSRTRDFPGIVTLPPGVETIRPGEQGNVTVTLEPPALVPMEKNLRFAIRQGNRAAGFGMVTRILE